MGVIGFCIGARSVMRTIRQPSRRVHRRRGRYTRRSARPMTPTPPTSPCRPTTGYLYVAFGAEDKMQSA